MAKNISTGRIGEQMAYEYLIAQGYTILERNWRTGKAEIDLIAQISNVIVFVEVKTRKSEHYAKAELAIDHKKENLLADAAAIYLEQNHWEGELRFDTIAVLLKGKKRQSIRHTKDAFFPGLQ